MRHAGDVSDIAQKPMRQPDQQLAPTWSWTADNVAKRTSRPPAVTFHTLPNVATARSADHSDHLTAAVLTAARPRLQSAELPDVVLHRWRHATPDPPHPQHCWTAGDARLLLAGDAFGRPHAKGPFLPGLAAATALTGTGTDR